MIRIRDQRSFVAGLLFLSIGAFAIQRARDYAFGTVRHMGPGWFPTILGIILAAIGAVTLLRAVTIDGPALGPIAWRPAIALTAGAVAFAAVVDRNGLVPAVLAITVLGCLAGNRVRPLEILFIAIVLAAMAAAIFIYGLSLPFTLFGQG